MRGAKEYAEEDFLQLSGLQHFAFCRRQWALIHIEAQWQENLLTVEGNILHEKAHAELSSEKRGELILSRAMPVFSRTLGLNGVCDVVELHRDEALGVPIQGRAGRYRPVPVEYKRGKPKEGEEDVLQLAAQAICLEEMLACRIPQAYLYYGQPRRREPVEIDDALRARVAEMAEEMHGYFARGYTPQVRYAKKCARCSLLDLCMPKMFARASGSDYMRARLEEVE